jgi:hypothetical protein
MSIFVLQKKLFNFLNAIKYLKANGIFKILFNNHRKFNFLTHMGNIVIFTFYKYMLRDKFLQNL